MTLISRTVETVARSGAVSEIRIKNRLADPARNLCRAHAGELILAGATGGSGTTVPRRDHDLRSA